eukprot:TRINITY_DN17663_c0_g1::TRINITY_DN17663_c0_g1_i1::g.11403::m.11403 TRINITY_DN17663_c0_g1::TRINITY_DN17663_c0_g1_i1::g.11403  ORF type:complete len:121 (+),score=18.45,Chibby/PF14645.1/0.09,Rtt102p/PF09510.5/0.25 TRINITY_DN17663_c0_g1_i1:46-408(+)
MGLMWDGKRRKTAAWLTNWVMKEMNFERSARMNFGMPKYWMNVEVVNFESGSWCSCDSEHDAVAEDDDDDDVANDEEVQHENDLQQHSDCFEKTCVIRVAAFLETQTVLMGSRPQRILAA